MQFNYKHNFDTQVQSRIRFFRLAETILQKVHTQLLRLKLTRLLKRLRLEPPLNHCNLQI